MNPFREVHIAQIVARAYAQTISRRVHFVPYDVYDLIALVEAVATLGALVAAARALPARVR